jgi:hypothetical protein
MNLFRYSFRNRIQRIGNDENMRRYVVAMLFIIRLRLHVGSRLNCSAQVESEKMDDVTFVLYDQDCVPGRRSVRQFIAETVSVRR